LYGRTVDLLLGYGLAYVVSVPLLMALTLRTGAGEGPLWVATVLALAISTPHYGATLLRVYDDRRERRAYAFFTVWVTLLVAVLFVAGLHSAWIGSVLLTAYVTWGIWHFSAQNYGIAVMYLRRRGLDLDPGLKRALYASFVLSAFLAIVTIYVEDAALSFSAGSQDMSGTYQVMQLRVPQPVRRVLDAVAISGYLLALGLVGWRLSRRVRLRRMVPVALLLLTQALWYSVPAIGTILGAWGSDQSGYAFAAVWISTAHAAQYLWISTFYAQRVGRCPSLARFYGRCLLAGAAVTGPGLLLAPGLLGGVAVHGSAIVVLVFAVVNLHHFALDSAIWKLRNGRVARLLIRSEPDPEPQRDRTPRWRPLRVAVFGLGALVLLQQLYGAWAVRLVFAEGTPLTQRHAAARDLHWLGLDTPGVWLSLGQRADQAGSEVLAIAAYSRALAVQRDPPAWARVRLAGLLLGSGARDGRAVDEAIRQARRAARTGGSERTQALQLLGEAHALRGHWTRAAAAAQAAMVRSRGQGDPQDARRLRRMLERYRALAAGGETGAAR
jgi:hypothetical protein